MIFSGLFPLIYTIIWQLIFSIQRLLWPFSGIYGAILFMGLFFHIWLIEVLFCICLKW